MNITRDTEDLLKETFALLDDPEIQALLDQGCQDFEDFRSSLEEDDL